MKTAKLFILLSLFISSYNSAFAWGSKTIETPYIELELINDSPIPNDQIELHLKVECLSKAWGTLNCLDSDLHTTKLFDLSSRPQNDFFTIPSQEIKLQTRGETSIDYFLKYTQDRNDVFQSIAGQQSPMRYFNLKNWNRVPIVKSSRLERTLKKEVTKAKKVHIIGLKENTISLDILEDSFRVIPDEQRRFAHYNVEVYFSTDPTFKQSIPVLTSSIYTTKESGQGKDGVFKIGGDLTQSGKFAIIELDDKITSGYLKMIIKSNHNNDYISPDFYYEKIAPFEFDKGKWPVELTGKLD